MARLFGTDGVRGLANAELTPELAFRLGRAGACIFMKKTNSPNIIIGSDSRLSGDMLEAALTAGICSSGAVAHRAGVVPTPAIAHLTKRYGMDAGIMISASHNPMLDNGIKFFGSGGYKLDDKTEDEIEELIKKTPGTKSDGLPRPTGASVGFRRECGNALADYMDYLMKEAKKISGASDGELPNLLRGMKIAVDCANGATSEASLIYYELGAEVFIINNEPDGTNINDKCGSTHLESIRNFARETGAHIGLAFDGDGDRILCADEGGNPVEGDQIMSVCGLFLKRRGALAKDSIVATVMSNLGLSEMCLKNGIDLIKAAVGDKYVLETMLGGGYNFGGEQSGHMLFLDHATTGDGLLTGLFLLLALKDSGKPFSELNTLMTVYPQFLAGAYVASLRKNEYATHAGIQNEIKLLEGKYAGSGRVLIRPSGTEPLVRVMIEGKDQHEIEADAKRLAALIQKEFA